jgi:hypothetical protein
VPLGLIAEPAMKARSAVLVFAGIVSGLPVLVGPATPSPLLGSWAVDVSRLPMPPAERPRSAVITFSDAGAGKWTTQVDIVYAGGEANHTVATTALDGTAAPVRNSPEADTAALKLPAPGVLVMDLVRKGIPASTRVYTVAPDGKTMIETASYVGDDGLPVMQTHYFTRVGIQRKSATT